MHECGGCKQCKREDAARDSKRLAEKQVLLEEAGNYCMLVYNDIPLEALKHAPGALVYTWNVGKQLTERGD